MNRQEMFDFVATKLIEQGGPANNVDGSCRYRTDKGRKCAAGWLIEDKFYDPRMENLSISAMQMSTDGGWRENQIERCDHPESLLYFGLIDSGVSPDDIEFVGQLQQAHDQPVTSLYKRGYGEGSTDERWLITWREQMHFVAQREGLSPAVLMKGVS